MNNNSIEQQICNMLEDGASYSEIQASLGVSSKTIAKVSKNKKEPESNNGKVFHDEIPPYFPSESGEPAIYPASEKYFLNDEKMKTTPRFATESDNGNPESKYSIEMRLEELRLRQDHEYRLKQFEWNKEKEERELALKAQELRQKQDSLNLEHDKFNQKFKELHFRLKSLTNECEQGTWDYNDLISLNNRAEKLFDKSERFFAIHGIEFEKSLFRKILMNIINIVNDLTEENEGEDEVEWIFDEEFEEVLRSAQHL